MRQQDLRGLLGHLRVDIVALEQFVKVRAIVLGQQGGRALYHAFQGILRIRGGVRSSGYPARKGHQVYSGAKQHPLRPDNAKAIIHGRLCRRVGVTR